tara:strand:- start:623 stop:832 length:210 start_codon:yes stop_codon:yes gene_type:complete
MLADKVVKLALKLLVKQFKLDKLEKVYKYVFEDNETDKQVKKNTEAIEQIKKNLRGTFAPPVQKKWYDK